MDLIEPLHRTDRGNEYIVVMQDHFTKWIRGAAVATKEAMLVADVIVNEWVYKHSTREQNSPQPCTGVYVTF